MVSIMYVSKIHVVDLVEIICFHCLYMKVLILENILHWAGVVDELEFVRSLLT